jgi:conjugal transfer pilus assembly protein TraF
LPDKYGLFFFYKGDCKCCEGFSLMLKMFSKMYDWKVIAISVDGSSIKEFPDAQTDNGIVEQWKITKVPSVYMVNTETGDVIPVGYGLISMEQLENNILLAVSAIVEED